MIKWNLLLSRLLKKTFEAVWESSPWVKGMNSIYFNYKGKSIGLGRKIEREEKLLIKFISRKKSEYKFNRKTNC